jgi:hypothetical protein
MLASLPSRRSRWAPPSLGIATWVTPPAKAMPRHTPLPLRRSTLDLWTSPLFRLAARRRLYRCPRHSRTKELVVVARHRTVPRHRPLWSPSWRRSSHLMMLTTLNRPRRSWLTPLSPSSLSCTTARWRWRASRGLTWRIGKTVCTFWKCGSPVGAPRWWRVSPSPTFRLQRFAPMLPLHSLDCGVCVPADLGGAAPFLQGGYAAALEHDDGTGVGSGW